MKARLVKLAPLTACLLLSACASGPNPQVNYVKATERFEGTLPCSNCNGIDTDLVLQRDAITGAPGGFYLHEIKIDAPGGERVNTIWGNWHENQYINDFKRQLYVLRPEVGETRTYIRLDNGSLQPLTEQGEPAIDEEGESVTLQLLTPSLSMPTDSDKSS
ncbi:copper resistance protein NlpE N-terminal domain-containing protein [Salinicola halophyticus]|uniref:copper resistance protein NlpE N-terminal domain-containing protein n=1 Tax=Salinicola halophyticus TaxID=1808881 RepID=UPI000DA1C292|nr:copper resistance protein NlpE N-terminal domain-containing protein [Salinicola halophyticus]